MSRQSAIQSGARASTRSFKCIYLSRTPSPQTSRSLATIAGINASVLHTLRYELLPAIAVIVDSHGLPVWPASLFLASKAISSQGMTGDTVRTYGESLLPWLEYIASKKHNLDTVDEELLKIYRIHCVYGVTESGNRFSSATANLRVAVAIQFHRWCQSNGYTSPLGHYLENHLNKTSSIAPRVIRRHPKILSFEEIQRILYQSRDPYKLMMRWGLVTGLRRFEVGGLQLIDLPSPEETSFFSDGLARFDIVRKGGRTLTVYAPKNLIEDTNWYVLADRPEPQNDFKNFVFINSKGKPVSRQAVSREFRRCANEIGSKATLHHLRHTFAGHVLSFLDNRKGGKQTVNALKVVQVLLGHASMETTEIYLRALDVSDQSVVDALEYLNGGVL